MKIKIIAILLIGLLASCTKDETKPIEPITINGTWYDEKEVSKRTISETFNISDSTYLLKSLKTNYSRKERFYLLPFNKMKIGTATYTYEVDNAVLYYGGSYMYR